MSRHQHSVLIILASCLGATNFTAFAADSNHIDNSVTAEQCQPFEHLVEQFAPFVADRSTSTRSAR